MPCVPPARLFSLDQTGRGGRLRPRPRAPTAGRAGRNQCTHGAGRHPGGPLGAGGPANCRAGASSQLAISTYHHHHLTSVTRVAHASAAASWRAAGRQLGGCCPPGAMLQRPALDPSGGSKEAGRRVTSRLLVQHMARAAHGTSKEVGRAGRQTRGRGRGPKKRRLEGSGPRVAPYARKPIARRMGAWQRRGWRRHIRRSPECAARGHAAQAVADHDLIAYGRWQSTSQVTMDIVC